MASFCSSSFSDQYPYPSLINVGNFVSVKLTPSNYPVWEVQMRSLIRSQNLFGFIDGKNEAPSQIINVPTQEGSELTAENDNPEYLAWSRIDWLLKGWIIGSFSEEVLGFLLENYSAWESGTGRDLWIKLASAFTPENRQVQPAESEQRESTGGITEGQAGFEGKTEQESNSKLRELIVAIFKGARLSVVKHLLESFSKEDLAMQDGQIRGTALHAAAGVGNIQVIKLLVQKAPILPYIRSYDGFLPLHVAASFRHREVISYLMKVTEDKEAKPFEDQSGVRLLNYVMADKNFDMALQILQCNPMLAWHSECTVLKNMAEDSSLFLSGARLNIWQYFIYSCVSMKIEDLSNLRNRGDMDNAKGNQIIREKIISVFQNIQEVVQTTLEILVPLIKDIRHKKLIHHQAFQLVRYLCSQVQDFDHPDCIGLLKFPFILGAQHGIHEIVNEILKILDFKQFQILDFEDDEGHNPLHLAVMYRREKVFNILYQCVPHERVSFYKILVERSRDHNENTILHLAGYMAHQYRLDLVSGGALQMQRELQWFKELENLFGPGLIKEKNKDGKTALMIFNEEHEKLVKSETQWVQGMANSCTLAASLVATVVFAAAITVPGGNSSVGIPVFSEKRAFIIFAISDAVGLFLSLSSVLSFLSVLTSRFAVIDFLYSLPKRLIIGLITLFISITSVIIAFSAALYLVCGQGKAWFLLLIFTMACLPVTLFLLMQFPLLLNMIKSTYGPGIIVVKSSDQRSSFTLKIKIQKFLANMYRYVGRVKFHK